jgi:nicotinamide riboside transporter PnuC
MCTPTPENSSWCIELFGLTFTTTYLYYVVGFFGGLFGGLFFLLNYNLIKMFGWDEDAQVVLRDLLGWFTTPPTASEQEALERERAGLTGEEETPFG